MKTSKACFACFAAVVLCAGCEKSMSEIEVRERGGAACEKAMADYQAGRLAEAVAGFEKAIRIDPATAGYAHFQLATILQDNKKDYIGAIAHYREYAAMHPAADKAEMAKARAALCESLLRAEYLKNGPDGSAEIIEALKATNAVLKAELAKTAQSLEKAEKTIQTRDRELENMRKFLSKTGEDETLPGKPKTYDKSEALALSSDAHSSLKEMSAQIADLKNELKELDEMEVKPSAPLATNVTNKVPFEFGPKDAKNKSAKEPRPEFYVVCEGDTLFSIARKFYGKQSMWIKIREANKTLISSDNRIVPGQKLKLP